MWRGALVQSENGYVVIVKLRAPLEGVKRATPKAHQWVNDAIVNRANNLIGAQFPEKLIRVRLGPVVRSEVVVRGPDEVECDRIRQTCLNIIEAVEKAVHDEFYGFHWLLPDDESATTMLVFQRLEGLIGGMTAMIGPASRDVLAELKAAGWQLQGQYAKRTIRAEAVQDTIEWLQSQGIYGPT